MTSIEQKMVKCEPDDPYRCQGGGTSGEGQCPFLSLAGLVAYEKMEPFDGHETVDRCPKCGGHSKKNKIERERVHAYRLQTWQERMGEFAEDERVKSLRGEIGILRLLIESVIQRCKTQADLVLYSGRISDLVTRTEKLVVSCDKLETSMGMVMDRTAALAFASQVVDIISAHVEDAKVIDAISSGIIDALGNISGEKD